jgi:recombination protein RecA
MADLMPMKKKTLAEKKNLLDKIAAKVNKKYGKAILGRIGANPEIADRLSVKWIPFACPDLNVAVGGGIPRRRCTLIAGLPDSGKTSLILETIGKEMQRNEDFVACWVESENSLDQEYICKTHNIDPERLVYIPVDSGTSAEEILDILYETMKTGSIDICCINSLKSLVPTQEMEASLSNAVVGTQARMNARITRKFNAVVAEFETAFVLITHLTTQIGTMSRDPLIVAGGHAIQYWSSLTLDMRKKSISDGDPISKEEGVKIGVTVRKNHVMPDKYPYVKLDYYAVFGKGIETVFSALAAAVNKGICRVTGAWIRQYNPETGEEVNAWNGKKAFRAYMLDNPDEFEEFSAQVYGGVQLSEEEVEKIQAEDAAIAKVAEKNVGKNKKAKKISKAEKVEDPTDAIVEAIEQEDVG